MSNYDIENPIVSCRFIKGKEMKKKMDEWLKIRKESRQEYVERTLKKDLSERGVIKITIE